MTPLIIEAAINGATSKSRNPTVPKTPQEVTAEALDCLDAGASVIHSHIEDLWVIGPPAAERYLEAYRPVIAARPDAILCPTAGAGGTLEERWKHTEIMAESGLIRMSVLDPGSINMVVRNAVCIDTSHQVVLAMARNPITFYDFAQFLRDKLQCVDALYLDGSISRIYPSLEADLGPAFGAMIAVVKAADK